MNHRDPVGASTGRRVAQEANPLQQKTKRQRLISPFLSGLLVWTLIGGYFVTHRRLKRVVAAPTTGRAAHASKLSDDLRVAIQQNPHGLVPVIITAPSKPTSGLWNAVASTGGSYHGFNHLPAISLKVPAFLVSTRIDVLHISLDRPGR